MRPHVTLFLTAEQIDALEPLFDLVETDFEKDKRGAIFCQIYEYGKIEAEYLENDIASKILPIITTCTCGADIDNNVLHTLDCAKISSDTSTKEE